MDVVRWRSPGQPDVVGIVGGGAKAGNLEKFRAICKDLYDLCVEHNARPVVFASETTPAGVDRSRRRRSAMTTSTFDARREMAHDERDP